MKHLKNVANALLQLVETYGLLAACLAVLPVITLGEGRLSSINSSPGRYQLAQMVAAMTCVECVSPCFTFGFTKRYRRRKERGR